MSTSVKFFHSGMPGAPVGIGNWSAGEFIAVLDAALVNGFNERTATGISVSSGVATATLPSGHGFEVDSVVLVSGATPSGLNGEKRVLTTAATTITFSAAGVSDGAATGTILVRYAPLGWTKAFTGTNSAAYRSNDVTATQMFLSVTNDLATNQFVNLRAWETLTAVATGAGQFPTTSQVSAYGAYKGVGRWLVVGDSKTFYLLHNTTSSFNSGALLTFGDFVSFSTLDPHRCVIVSHSSSTGGASTSLTTGSNQTAEFSNPTTTGNTFWVSRSRSGVAGGVSPLAALESFGVNASTTVSGGSSNPGGTAFATYPAPANQGLILSRVILAEGGGPRGYLRGLFHTPQNCHTSFNQMDRVTGQGAFTGRKLMALKCGSPAGTTSQGVVFVDITGPWES